MLASTTDKHYGKNSRKNVTYLSDQNQGNQTTIAMAYAMKRTLEVRVNEKNSTTRSNDCCFSGVC